MSPTQHHFHRSSDSAPTALQPAPCDGGFVALNIEFNNNMDDY